MKRTLFYILPALVMIGAASVNAQVIIGSASKDPHTGAILDLASGGQNNLGMLLPNVVLSGNAAEFTLGSVASDPTAATGMIVYNTSYSLKGPGLYVWNGTSWKPLKDPCPNSITDERDGNWYCTGDFGDAGTWMTQNLRYSDGLSENYSPSTDCTTCFAYPNKDKTILNPGKHPEYGLLYTWAAATGRTGVTAKEGEGGADEGSAPTVRGICPAGWHVPSDREWNDLEKVIAGTDWLVEDGKEIFRTTIGERGTHGAKMRSRTSVNGKNSNGSSKTAAEGGFDALPVGYVGLGNASRFGYDVYFWSGSSEGSSAWLRYLAGDRSTVIRSNASNKPFMYSIRCKKDN